MQVELSLHVLRVSCGYCGSHRCGWIGCGPTLQIQSKDGWLRGEG